MLRGLVGCKSEALEASHPTSSFVMELTHIERFESILVGVALLFIRTLFIPQSVLDGGVRCSGTSITPHLVLRQLSSTCADVHA